MERIGVASGSQPAAVSARMRRLVPLAGAAIMPLYVGMVAYRAGARVARRAVGPRAIR